MVYNHRFYLLPVNFCSFTPSLLNPDRSIQEAGTKCLKVLFMVFPGVEETKIPQQVPGPASDNVRAGEFLNNGVF